MKSPLFSVITVTYNAISTIESTIQSIISQTFDNFEYIIIDGNSNDGTLDIIQKYKSDITCIVSEKDTGIYDAMNKGISLSKGQYLYFIGGDDVLYDSDVLNKVSKELLTKEVDLLVGDVFYTSGRLFKSFFGFKTLLNNTIHHQGAFYNRRLFLSFRYDTTFRLIADFELNLKIFINKNHSKVKFIHNPISICMDGGASRKELDQAYNETNKIRTKVLGNKSFLLKGIYTIKFFITRYAF